MERRYTGAQRIAPLRMRLVLLRERDEPYSEDADSYDAIAQDARALGFHDFADEVDREEVRVRKENDAQYAAGLSPIQRHELTYDRHTRRSRRKIRVPRGQFFDLCRICQAKCNGSQHCGKCEARRSILVYDRETKQLRLHRWYRNTAPNLTSIDVRVEYPKDLGTTTYGPPISVKGQPGIGYGHTPGPLGEGYRRKVKR